MRFCLGWNLLVMCHVCQQGSPMRTRASVVGGSHHIPHCRSVTPVSTLLHWEVMRTTRPKRVWIVATQPEPDVNVCTRMALPHASMSPLTAEAAADSLPGFSASSVELMWTKCHKKRHVGEHSWVVTSALFPQQLLALLRGSSKVKRMILASQFKVQSK